MESKIKDGNIEAIIYIDKTYIDIGTMKQIREILKHPAMENANVRIMPDCCRSHGCCVGLTANLTSKIVPKFVGGDIGCGIVTYPMGNILNDHTIENIEKTIKELTPLGSGKSGMFDHPVITNDDLLLCLQNSFDIACSFVQKYNEKFNVNIDVHIPKYDLQWYYDLCSKIQTDPNYDLSCVGTLGSGNHYIEVNIDRNNCCYLTVHCGSRNIGSKICNYHQNKIDTNNKIDYDDLKDHIKQIDRKTRDSKMKKKYIDDIKQNMKDNLHTEYLELVEAYEYYFDMIFAQAYAQMNRHTIVKRILNKLNISYDSTKNIESIHNYIDFQNLILRKGAISAYLNELCIISLNMRDGIMICKGKGNVDWNYSSAHGSGRVISREMARQKFNMTEYKKSMEGIYSTSVCDETLDECPMAYKNSDLIKSILHPTVDIIETLKPIINVKGFD